MTHLYSILYITNEKSVPVLYSKDSYNLYNILEISECRKIYILKCEFFITFHEVPRITTAELQDNQYLFLIRRK
jgi:hypothetical protein